MSSFNGTGNRTSAFAFACPAIAAFRALFRVLHAGIIGCVFVAPLAVCLRLLAKRVCRSADGEAIQVKTSSWNKNILWCHSLAVSKIDGVPRNPGFLCPLLDCLSFALKCNSNIARPVIHLVFARCPTAILGAIISVIIISFNGIAGRSRSHISLEKRKIVPSGTHPNSTASVTVIGRVRGAITSRPQMQPNTVNAGMIFHWSALISSWPLHIMGV